MHSFVDFQVDWPMLLFRSRPQIPCRNTIHVATSISRRDINLSLWSYELVSSSVATSISCRDINLSLWRLQLVAFGVAISVLCRDITLSYISFIFPTYPSFKVLLLSRPPSLVATSTSIATSLCCRDIIP